MYIGAKRKTVCYFVLLDICKWLDMAGLQDRNSVLSANGAPPAVRVEHELSEGPLAQSAGLKAGLRESAEWASRRRGKPNLPGC